MRGFLLRLRWLVLSACLVPIGGCGAEMADPSAQRDTVAHLPNVVVGYFTEWGIYTADYTLADVPADRLTHLIYAFTKIEDGRIAVVDPQAAYHFELPPERNNGPWPQGQLAQLRFLRERYPHLRILVAVGGWTLSANFSDAVASASARTFLADSIVEFLVRYQFDGVDLDWEYPVSGGLPDNTTRLEDTENYVLLVRLLRKRLQTARSWNGENFLITVATPPGASTLANFDLRAMAPYVDWFNIMAYDYHGAWSDVTGHLAPITGPPGAASVMDTVRRHKEQGVPARQLVLGIPLFARAWRGVETSQNGLFQQAAGPFLGGEEPGHINYAPLMLRRMQDPTRYTLHLDSEARAEFIFNPTLQDGAWFSLETPSTFRAKNAWARTQGLRGIMFWSLEGDIRDTGNPNSIIGGLPQQAPGAAD